MSETIETNSRGFTLPYRIEKKYLGRLADDATEQDLADCCRLVGMDIAIELRGENVELFSVRVRAIPKVTHALWGNKRVIFAGYN